MKNDADLADLLERDAAHLWHPYTRHGFDCEPLAVVGAEGSLLHLADGRTLIDGISSWWATLHGHCHPELVEAMHDQAQRLDHVLFAGATHEPAVRLAEELVEVAPAGLSRVFYSDNGSTAVEVALKIAYHAAVLADEPQRRTFVALEGGYHGDTFGAMAAGDPVPFFEAYLPLLFDVRRVPARAEAIEQTLRELGGQVAGVVVEPLLQGAAGMRMYDESVLRTARAICDELSIPLIADEVLTGFGRTGALFACARAGIAPDLLCVAKGLTGGTLPLAATLATESLFEAFVGTQHGFFPHGHTFTAHPIGCAVALASLRLCRENAVPERLEAIGRRIDEGLVELEDHPAVRDWRRIGGVVALELAPRGGEQAGYMAELGPRLRAGAVERGVLLRPLGNVLYAIPPACTSDAQCDVIARTMVALVHDLC